jgi:hypothetical protein
MEREVGMNGHDIVGGILAVKAGIDTIKSLSGLFPIKKTKSGLIPVYHLVTAKQRKAEPSVVGTEIPGPASVS